MEGGGFTFKETQDGEIKNLEESFKIQIWMNQTIVWI